MSHDRALPSAITTGNLTSTMQLNGAFQPMQVTEPNPMAAPSSPTTPIPR